MTSITSSASSNILSSVSSSSSSSSSSSTSSASDLQSQFLTLLTTQLKNQDPLNPMDNSQMTTQLAQISSLESLQNLNTTLSSLLDSYGTSQALQASSAIGSTVLAKGNNLTLSSSVAEGAVTLDSAASSVVVTIKDSSGNVVQTTDLGAKSAGTVAFSWDGTNSSGTQLSDGNYTYSVKATDSGGSTVNTTALEVGTVAAVVKSGSSYKLQLKSGETLAYDDVLQFM
jgi:flagellar basal-body rod modification protein FlgD